MTDIWSEIEAIGPVSEGCDIDEVKKAEGRYLLVERGSYDGSYWISRHETLENAGRYSVEQEYPSDWSIEVLIDLKTGAKFDALPAVNFVERKPS